MGWCYNEEGLEDGVIVIYIRGSKMHKIVLISSLTQCPFKHLNHMTPFDKLYLDFFGICNQNKLAGPTHMLVRIFQDQGNSIPSMFFALLIQQGSW
jgi:hypothetical protein